MPRGRSHRKNGPSQEPGVPFYNALPPQGSTFQVSQLQQVLPFGVFQNVSVHPSFVAPSANFVCVQRPFQPGFQPPSLNYQSTHLSPGANGGRMRGRGRNQKPEFVRDRPPQEQNLFQVEQGGVDSGESYWSKKKLYAMVKAFVDDPNIDEMSFPPTLTATERHMVHQAALNFSLHHKSSGSRSERVLTLRKIGNLVEQQKQQEKAALDGIRVKTIDGYQGAQRLPDEYMKSKITEITSLVQPLLKRMYTHLKATANRPPRTRHLTVVQPGLGSAPKGSVSPSRYHELQGFRMSLPSYKRKDEIIEAVRRNSVVIVSGDTGCGKTTQIPQLLYDSNLFRKDMEIICTQPRRISALSVAHRVAEERGEACGDSCGYNIRFDNMTSSNSKIVYMTTGILLRRLHSDPQLAGVSCVIVDEVHERDVETDFCLLLLRDRILEQQRSTKAFKDHIKIVVMSATVQLGKLTSYYSNIGSMPGPPVITIPGTLFPVEEYFLEDALKWVQMPASAVPAMSAFSTEPEKKSEHNGNEEDNKWTLYEKLKDSVFQGIDRDPETILPYELLFKLIVYLHKKSTDLSESILVFLPGWASISRITTMIQRSPVARELSVLQLHSSLTAAEQRRVFDRPPKRYRKVVLSTNIAETSITIDDAVYVIDSCLAKGTSYDPVGDTSALKATYISKANGLQRRGRAGRCQAGICVHLLPRLVYETLPDFLPPDIMRTPLEEVCLQVKALKPDESCAKVLSRALDAPSVDSTEHAVRFLVDVGAFTHVNERLTSLGRALSRLPVHPLLGKMLLAATCLGVLDPIATIAAYLSGKSPFIKPLPHQKAGLRRAMQAIDNGALSDHLCVLKLFDGWKKAKCSADYAQQQFADQTVLHSMDRTRKQLLRLVQNSSMLQRVKDPMRVASRHANNLGLVRIVALWSLYPRIASIEYRAARNRNRVEIYCWDNKIAQVSMGSTLTMQKRGDFGDRAFVFYNERMQLEATLTLFDATSVTPLEVALCLRELAVTPLAEVPSAFLTDDESKMAPGFPFTLKTGEEAKDMAALFFDGDKKVYVAPSSVASTLRNVRDCMDYYLAWSINMLRADLFPEDLTRALAYTIGYPLSDVSTVDANEVHESVAYGLEGNEGQTSVIEIGGNVHVSSDSVEDDDVPEISLGEFDDFHLTEEEIERATATLGELTVFNRHGGARLLGAFRKGEQLRQIQSLQGTTENNTVEKEGSSGASDDDDDDDDIIVAQVGELVMEDDGV